MVLTDFCTTSIDADSSYVCLSIWNERYVKISVRRLSEFSERIYGELPLWF
jgi:hypothetical protein